MTAFASPQVEDAVRSALEAIVNKAHQPDVRSSRVRFTGDRGSNNFVWIMIDRTSIPSNGTPVDGFYIHTNDIDLFAATPPSFSETCPTTDTAATIESAVQYVASKVGASARIELLLQSDFNGDKHEANYVGNSDDGFDSIHQQPVLFTD
ncbi:MAG: hypothetical protein JST44_11955 [Cyanobacteria bacterium SZAS LIN-5]|nr:hypothetical protein [Cyanobacteria bacterium SZAS LIN-5]RTL40148.1 MAG: hypothetical protein EKK48_16985 [Candidatus Melainabacteria bacterium]